MNNNALDDFMLYGAILFNLGTFRFSDYALTEYVIRGVLKSIQADRGQRNSSYDLKFLFCQLYTC